MMRRYSNNGGFTLLELLVAMVLLAVIVGLVVSAMRIGFRTIESGDRMVVSLERARASIQVFEGHLMSVMKMRTAKEAQAGEQPVQFAGASDSMTFHSYHSLWGGAKGPVSVSYRVTDDGGKKSLRLTETPTVIAAPREALLFSGVQDIAFAYFGRGVTDETGKWFDEWEDTSRLPERVRMSVKKDRHTITVMVAIPLAEKVQSVAEGKLPGQ